VNLGWIFTPYISAIQGTEFIHVTLQNFLNPMGWIFILQGDEIQGMILIQDDIRNLDCLAQMVYTSVYWYRQVQTVQILLSHLPFLWWRVWIFNHLTYKFSSRFSTQYGMVFSARVCFSAWDRKGISYHYEVLLIGKFHSLKVELTAYISCPKEGFLQGISQILFHKYHSRISIYVLSWHLQCTAEGNADA